MWLLHCKKGKPTSFHILHWYIRDHEHCMFSLNGRRALAFGMSSQSSLTLGAMDNAPLIGIAFVPFLHDIALVYTAWRNPDPYGYHVPCLVALICLLAGLTCAIVPFNFALRSNLVKVFVLVQEYSSEVSRSWRTYKLKNQL
jgi:hypothetical protein